MMNSAFSQKFKVLSGTTKTKRSPGLGEGQNGKAPLKTIIFSWCNCCDFVEVWSQQAFDLEDFGPSRWETHLDQEFLLISK